MITVQRDRQVTKRRHLKLSVANRVERVI